MTAQAVGVVGASARAAAMSLLRAGFTPWAVDLFADRDLTTIAPSVRCSVDDYPQGLPALCEQFPPGPFLYTGGLENHPNVIRTLAACRELWGNGPAVLDHVRDPFRLTQLLHAHHVRYPRVLPGNSPVPASGQWLRKSLHSAGGLGVRFAMLGEPGSPSTYLQEYAPGEPMSALYNSDASGTRFLGVTQQLIGLPWAHARDFRYVGNIGPFPIDSELREELSTLGNRVQSATGLSGPWGVDFLRDDNRPVVVEINPRYSAAMEVLELATKTPVLTPHAVAAPPQQVVGKAIWFAPYRIVVPAAGPWNEVLRRPFDPWNIPRFADIPEAGGVIESGWPVLTVFAVGSTPADCHAQLQSRALELDRLFTEPQP